MIASCWRGGLLGFFCCFSRPLPGKYVVYHNNIIIDFYFRKLYRTWVVRTAIDSSCEFEALKFYCQKTLLCYRRNKLNNHVCLLADPTKSIISITIEIVEQMCYTGIFGYVVIYSSGVFQELIR